MECAGCGAVVNKKPSMKCSLCEKIHCLLCSGIDESDFPSLSFNYKATWNCVICCGKKRKGGDNSGTPVRAVCVNSGLSAPVATFDNQNVTRRNKNVAAQSSKLQPQPCGSASRPIAKISPPDASPMVSETRLREILQEEVSAVVRKTIKAFVDSELAAMKEQLSEFGKSISFFNTQFEEIKATVAEKNVIIKDLVRDNQNLLATVNDVSTRLQLAEQHLRESNVEINGLPEHKSENLVTTLLHLGSVVENPLVDADILHISRVAKLNRKNDDTRPRTVVVKLRSQRHRDSILAAVARFNRKNAQDKLSTNHLGLAGPRNPVFVSEHLSPSNKALHAATRIEAKTREYKFVWVRNGRIYVRKNESSQAIHIRNKESLHRM